MKNGGKNKTSFKNVEEWETHRRGLSKEKQTVYYIHLKEQLKSMFVDTKSETNMHYAKLYQPSEGVFGDVFDGDTIKKVVEKDTNSQEIISGKNIYIYVGLMQDGFTSRDNHTNVELDSKTHSYTIFQLVCYSLSPALR